MTGQLSSNALEQMAGLIPTLEPAKAVDNIVIAATFTAEPLEESLHFWLTKFHIDATVQLAAFNQVFQQLLDPASLWNTNERGLNCLLVRPLDLVSSQDEGSRDEERFISALQGSAAHSRVPILLIVCPGRPDQTAQPESFEARLRKDLARHADLHVVTPAELDSLYPVDDYLDARADELGRIPYSQTYFTALGTMVARKYHALKRPAYKVIVLDCDNTLWTGVCGEDGASGIILDEPRMMLQQFMLDRRAGGMLLCVCSKNSEGDVEAVFRNRADMVLKRDHFAAWRVNWQPKSENIRSIAKELNLGLGSVLFLDDNPAECAEVRANCPEVLCLELPEPARVPAFLQHVWAFDLAKVTDEDAARARQYQDNRERAAFEAEAPTYADFIKGLNLAVDIGEMTAEQLPRLAQLTQRTNQFNFTGRVRTVGEVRAFVECPEVTALTVTVTDRFGNYGLVGTVIYSRCATALQVDTFLLSCRVLGKGVEHAMLARLGMAALHYGLDTVEIPFIPTPRNPPASEFLQSVGRDFHSDTANGSIYRFPADQAAAVRFDPSMRAAASAKQVSYSQTAGFSNPSGKGKPASELFAWIESHASSAHSILKAIEAEAAFAGPSCAGYVAPRTELEQRISQIWKKLLRREPIGVRDNFFQLGGDSVIAMRLFVKLENLTGKRLPLATLFEAPTIELLAKLIEDQGWEPAWQSLVAIKAGGSKPPLYCVHGVGGNIVSYMDLAKYLEPDQPLYGLQAVGLNGKRPRRNLTVEEMAAIYIQEVCAFQPRGPYFLGGTSFGGLVAYEMAQQLVKAGEEVALLALFDTYGPGYPRLLPGTTVWRARWNHLRMRFNLHWGNLMATAPHERLGYVAAKLARLKTTARRVMRTKALLLKAEFRDRVNRLLRPHVIRQVSKAGHWAAGDYEPKPFNGSITLFRATEQPHGIHPDPYLGWEPLVPTIKIYNTPGHHGGIVLEPRVKILSDQLADALRQARSQALQPQNNLPRSA